MIRTLVWVAAAAVVLFPMCAAAQGWAMPDSSTIATNCDTSPCKVVINEGTTTSAVTLDANGIAVFRNGLSAGHSAVPEYGYTLDVVGGIRVSGPFGAQRFDPRDGAGTRFSWYNPTGDYLQLDNAGTFVITNTGRLGLGTTAPVHALDVQAASDTTTFPGTPVTMLVGDRNAAATANTGAGIGFTAAFTSAGAVTTIGAIAAVKESTVDGHYGGALTFGTRTNGSDPGTMERMRIRSDGEVIIGPPGGQGQRLTVNGDVTVSGNIAAKYQDVAEWVPATSDLAPGTVVVLNPEATNEVMISAGAYDTRVAGVVSAQPGLILGEAGDAKEMIATTGRVKLKVDATRAAIIVGDLLVTSDKPGMAMRSEPLEIGGRRLHQPGTIIGKALEPLASGEGEILVLLSLQ